MKYSKTLLIVAAALLFCSFDLPKGWFIAGSKPQLYHMGIDPNGGRDGKHAATIQGKKKARGFGTLMQNCWPTKYLGKRVRMSGYLKSVDVKHWAGFWLRVDQASGPALSFDNMKTGEDRSVKGSTDWKKYDIVLDVPLRATNLAYGALLVGKGQIWFDDITFEVVNDSVPTTVYNNGKMPAEEPVNLDFEN